MERIRLGDACDILNGFAFKSDKYVEDGIRIIRIANVQKGYIEENAPAFYPIDSVGLEKYMLEEGDLLMSLTGNVGRVALLQKEMLPAALNQRVACLRLKLDRITKGFLFHILNSDFFEQQCVQASNGVAQKNISTEWLKDYEIPLYSIEEQLKITDILDKVRRIIISRNDELSALDDLIKARFVEMFGDPVSNPMRWKGTILRTVCSKITDGEHGSVPRVEIGHPFLNAKHVLKNGLIDWASVSFTDDEVHEKLCRRCSPEKNDILMTTTGTIGNIAIVPDMESFSMDRGITLLKLDYELVDSVFIACMLRFDGIQALMQSNVHASAIGHLFLNKVEQIPIILPPLDMQRQFADFVRQVDKSKVAVQKALEETQLLFDSLMQQYFG